MIEWDALFLTIPLWLPELAALLTAIVFLIRQRPRLDGDVLMWLVVPCTVLAFSTATRFLPLWFEPVQDVIGPGSEELIFVWYGDLLFRSPAWAALLYGLFWKLPQRERVPPLDARTRQAATTAALLAVILAETQREDAESNPADAPASV